MELYAFTTEMTLNLLLYLVGGIVALAGCSVLIGVRYIPNRAVGIAEKLWSPTGSIAEGRMIVVDHEAGYRASVLRGSIYFLYWLWQYRIHRVPLAIVGHRSNRSALAQLRQLLT